MGDAEVPGWLKSLPLAPEYRPTETEFADPIAFISKIEEAAAEFGICKVVPPITKPSRKFVFHNLNRSLSKSPDLGPAVDGGNPRHTPEGAVFTTRHQELGSRRIRMQAIHKQVWQSGELYTLEQFEAKARAFSRAHLGGPKCVNPLFVEDMFWKAVEEKPICIEYANDVPGSGFGVPKEPFLFKPRRRWRRRFNRGGGNIVEEQCGNIPLGKFECLGPGNEWEGSAGWKLSNSPWNMQVIARSSGSLTRFMPDEVPGVTSPMVYIGMLFSWFAWHVEDHELHSMNFLHTGASKTWYAVPGSYASKFEEVVRMQGYGGLVDRLAAFTLLGEKTTLISPEVIVQSGIPCCRLVQHPGEFVVTFPRAYHVGFSHGFNCGEAANFATPKWLKVAKEAAVRRAAMNYLPMLSHQQLLYMLTMSFISRVPRAFLPGVRSSRLRDRKKEERETLVKKAFLDDLKDEHHLIHRLFGKDEAFYGVLWHPDLLPSPSNDSQKFPSSPCCEGSVSECRNEMALCDVKTNVSPEPKKEGYFEKDMADGRAENTSDIPPGSVSSAESQKYGDAVNILDSGRIQSSYVDGDDLPCGLDVDSGSLACVACGILGYPFMSIVQPSDKASKLLYAEREVTDEKVGNLKQTKTSLPFFLVDMTKESANSDDSAVFDSLPPTNINNSGHDNIMAIIKPDVYQVGPADKNDPERNNTKVDLNESDFSDKLRKDNHSMNSGVVHTVGDGSESPSNNSVECCRETGVEMVDLENKWNTSTKFLRPRIFCLQHALEICELLQSKGGAHVLIICHSDYLKIKAHAMSVAEDIDTRLDFEDVPLKDASQADLDLIYMSIDDEEHEEDGEDWTAEMGLNLRYCVKLRKQCSSNQEQLALGLDGIFSKKNPPVISGLKWHCRKSRTQQRMITPAHSRSQSTVNMYKGKPAMRSSFSDPCARTQIDKTCNNEMQHKRRRGRPRKNPSADLVSRTGASAPDDKTSILVPCSSECLTRASEVPVDGLSTLAGLPSTSALAPEDVQIHEECMIINREEAKPACVIDDSAKTEDTTSCSIPDVENYTSQLQINGRVVANCLDVISNPTASTQDLQRNKNCSSECGSENCEVGNFMDSECQPSIVSQTVTCLDRRQGSGHKMQTEGKIIMSDGSSELHDVLTTEETKVVFSSNVLNDQPMNYETIVNGSEVQQEMMNSTVCNSLVECFTKPEMGTNADADTRVGNVDSIDLTSSIRISNAKISEIPQIPDTAQEENSRRETFDLFKNVKEDGVRNTVQLKLYERRRKKRQAEAVQIKYDSNPILRKKRKRKGDQMLSVQLSCDGFVRSPCEGLRSRGGQAICEKAISSKLKKTSQVKRHWSEHNGLVGRKSIDESSGPYQCNLQGCHMSFQTGGELSLHKRNRCTYEGCGKRFSSHKYAVRHQCVHADERPLKCPWKGCNVTFKWDWARTEHVRVHTGERPYKCEVPGCGLAFRFISEFSRHRRKTGHPSGNFVASSTNM